VLRQVEEEHWRKLLLQRCAPLLEAAGVPYELEVITGYGADPLEGVADAVRGAAERLGADVLVLSGHGKAAWEQWLLGSVTNYCAHHCKQPVVVLHGSRWNM
jgi:nucleotide-binding universal stress UspA family protein